MMLPIEKLVYGFLLLVALFLIIAIIAPQSVGTVFNLFR
jgi:hypothetical protein